MWSSEDTVTDDWEGAGWTNVRKHTEDQTQTLICFCTLPFSNMQQYILKFSALLFQNPYAKFGKSVQDAIENMEKVGQKHQEEAEDISERIASGFCSWLRGLPRGETEDINDTPIENIRDMFNDKVG